MPAKILTNTLAEPSAVSRIVTPFPNAFYFEADLLLVKSIPPEARIILDVDCGEGRLAEVLKLANPALHITGIHPSAARSEAARSRVDRLIVGDLAQDSLAQDSLALAPQSFDCIIATTSLRQSQNPLALLEKMRPLLCEGGHLISSWPNRQHWSMINKVLRGDIQENAKGLFSPNADPFLGISNLIKLFLDAGYLPRLLERRYLPASKEWLLLMKPMLDAFSYPLDAFELDSGTYEYFIDAQPINNLPMVTGRAKPISIGVCVNDDELWQDNLLASPCLQSDDCEIFTFRNCASAAEGLNAAIAMARHELVLLIHQDVYLPSWWIHRLWEQYEKAQTLTHGRVGVMGLYGVVGTLNPRSIGRVCDRLTLLDFPAASPTKVDSLDELALIVPKGTPLRFEPALGWHLYGTDVCLQAAAAGLQALVIDAPCYHNAKRSNKIPQNFVDSEAGFRKKWAKKLPIQTVCALIS